jgi:dienelactone hydrolase
MWVMALCVATCCQTAHAQTGASIAATIAADLSFPTEPTAPADLTKKMALLVPDGAGPFPAIAMIHQCAGLNETIVQHAREAVASGFVVLVTDSLGLRAVTSVCYGPRNGVNFFRGVRDALQAVDHLRSLPMVDKTRVGLVGYSWGAMIGLMAASPMYRGWLGFHGSPAAVVSHYPGCFTITPPNRNRSFEVFSRDVDVPVLALLGSDDTETPPDECERKFKDANYPEMLDWHLYPGATHCWDCQQIDGLQKIDVRGNRVSYRYDADVTKDATERTFAFLKRAFELK